MKSSGNIVFISGGSAGIGFEIAKSLVEAGNQVIINGRNADRLQSALKQLPNVIGIQGDLSLDSDRIRIAEKLKNDFPALNVIINNAGEASVYSLSDGSNAYINAEKEIATNYLAIVHFTELLLQQLLNQEEAAIVNVTSIVALQPSTYIPTYSASKAALHSYTLSLRDSLKEKAQLRIFEVLPPLVNTAFAAPIGGAINGIPPQVVAYELLSAIKNDQLDVPVGKTKAVYDILSEASSQIKQLS